MKVYVLLESSGDYEDYREYIHSIYLDKDKCESVKNELEKSDKEYDKKKLLITGEIVENLFINLINTQQNSVQIGEDYFGIDNYDDMLSKYMDYKAAV